MKYYIDVLIKGRLYLDDEYMEYLSPLTFKQEEEHLAKMKEELAEHEFFKQLSNRKIILNWCGEEG